MSNKKEYENRINRIKEMEIIFDYINNRINNHYEIDECLKEKLIILTEYYENGLWLSDYEADERGELPSDLKRGVLSQDGIYNLLSEFGFNDIVDKQFFRR